MTGSENKTKKTHLIGYMRVSTKDQDLALQHDALLKRGVDPRDIYEDKATGKNMKRPGWQALLKDARQGDTVVIWKLERLARNVRQIIMTVDDFERRGITLESLDGRLDMTTAMGRAMFQFSAVMAELERGLISERTLAGLAVAKANGRRGGRKRIISDEEARDVWRRLRKGESLSLIAQSRQPESVTPQAYIMRFKALGLEAEDRRVE